MQTLRKPLGGWSPCWNLLPSSWLIILENPNRAKVNAQGHATNQNLGKTHSNSSSKRSAKRHVTTRTCMQRHCVYKASGISCHNSNPQHSKILPAIQAIKPHGSCFLFEAEGLNGCGISFIDMAIEGFQLRFLTIEGCDRFDELRSCHLGTTSNKKRVIHAVIRTLGYDVGSLLNESSLNDIPDKYT